MLPADLGERGSELALDHPAHRLGRQHGRERRLVERAGFRIVRPARDQDGAALAHIARDVVEIDDRQDALPRVAVKDDEVELVDLLAEQLAGREGDQRQFVDRGAVLLLRGPQNREVHEVDRGVGLEQVAPCPLARVRLARDQQHAQFFAHAVDGDDRAVVDRGDLLAGVLGLELDEVDAWMRHRHVDRGRLAGHRLDPVDDLPVAPHLDRHGAPETGPDLVDPEADALGLADDPEAGAKRQRDAAVALVRPAGDQPVDGRGEAEVARARRDVVDHPVGHEQRARDALGRHVGDAVAERREQLGAVARRAVLAGLDPAHLDVPQALQPRFELLADLVGLDVAAVERLTARAVDDDRQHVGQRLAILAGERGIRQCEQQAGDRARAQPRAAGLPEHAERRDHEARDREGDKRGQGDQRGEIDVDVHWLSVIPAGAQRRAGIGFRLWSDRCGATPPKPSPLWGG